MSQEVTDQLQLKVVKDHSEVEEEDLKDSQEMTMMWEEIEMLHWEKVDLEVHQEEASEVEEAVSKIEIEINHTVAVVEHQEAEETLMVQEVEID